jgi:hypothetical protein
MPKWLVQRQKNREMPKNQADFRSKKRGLLLNKKQKNLITSSSRKIVIGYRLTANRQLN